jgi:uncharacterized membrane protein YdjX (TVP38/TMEM64 family)
MMRRYRSLIFYVAAVVVLSLAYFASPISRESVWQLFPGTEAMAQQNPLVTALLFLVASIVLAFLAFPSMPMIYMAAGFYMEGFEGGATVLLGSALGGWSAFLFYRKHFRQPDASLNQEALPDQSAALSRKSARSIWFTLIGLRLSPLVPAPLVNFFAAVFNVSPFQYLTTSLIGSAPLVLFYAQIGQQGHQFLSGGNFYWEQLVGYLLILALSTLLSAMGPWRKVLDQFRQLKGSSASKALPLQPASGSNRCGA